MRLCAGYGTETSRKSFSRYCCPYWPFKSIRKSLDSFLSRTQWSGWNVWFVWKRFMPCGFAFLNDGLSLAAQALQLQSDLSALCGQKTIFSFYVGQALSHVNTSRTFLVIASQVMIPWFANMSTFILIHEQKYVKTIIWDNLLNELNKHRSFFLRSKKSFTILIEKFGNCMSENLLARH